jgi:2-polyprenyl-3-methyl-5-hydroxy-6-metoxy-1,4-benzoquinol methylase
MNGYNLPFKLTDKVIELGGGTNPTCPGRWVNLDIRWAPTVDIVTDLNEKLPITDESYDGVFANFVMEHLRLSRVPQFMAEVHRILKPLGTAVIITANLVEQARVIIEKEERGQFNNDIVHMVFGGDPDYAENYHKSSISPNYAMQLLAQTGFHDMKIYQHPAAMAIWGHSTDMIIEARKSGVSISRQLKGGA